MVTLTAITAYGAAFVAAVTYADKNIVIPPNSTLSNPSFPALGGASFSDPRTIKVDGIYYAFATNNMGTSSAKGVNVQIATTDYFGAAGWKLQDVDVLPHPGNWTYADQPDVQGSAVARYSDNHFVMFYAARAIKPNGQQGPHCIGVATATRVLGIYTPSSSPMLCPSLEGDTSAKNPNHFSENGTHYLVYKIGANYGSHIAIQQLTAQGTAFTKGTNPTKLYAPTHEEFDVGGPTIVKNPTNGHYMLLYATGSPKNSTYSIRYSSSDELVPANGRIYGERGILMETGDNNGVEVYAPGWPDFPDKVDNPQQMTFMTWGQDHYGKHVLRTTNVTFEVSDSMNFASICGNPEIGIFCL